MQTVSCSNCGTAIENNQRFCRRCGQPINLSEATTRTLDPPLVIEPTTQHINASPTTPSYLPAAAAPPLASPATSELRPAAQKRMMLIVMGLVGFLIGALIVLAVIASWLNRNPASEQPAMSHPQIPAPSVTPAPPVVGVPPVTLPPTHSPPPPLPPFVTVGGETAISREMVYPGARITTEINRSEGGSALQLYTEDSFDKVVAWYTAKLKPTSSIKSEGPTAILRGEGLTAIINSTGSGANIFLKQEQNRK